MTQRGPSAPASLPSQTLGLGELQAPADIHILIVDDDPGICTVVKASLGHPRFVVESLSEPSELHNFLEARRLRKGKSDQRNDPLAPFDLIILDYILPGLEPEQVLNWVADCQPEASVIVVTGHPSVESALTCLRARAFDYLTKPFQVSQLRDIVIRCLESKGLLRMSKDALKLALGAALRERRKSLDLTLSDVAERADVSLGYLSQIELGKNSASIETLYQICLALGIRMADLFQVVQKNP